MIRYIHKFSGVFLFFGSLIAITVLTSQNVGINTTTPQENLDVNGNIGVSGAIVPGGQAGTQGQLLQLQAGGGMAWVDMSKWENMQEYSVTTGTGFWTVPTGVTKVMFELWGGGGAGGAGGGGGSGSYVFGFINVSGGSVQINVGKGATNTGLVTATSSNITYGSSYVQATPGTSAGTNTAGRGGPGASANNTTGVIYYFSIYGQAGEPTRISYGLAGPGTNDHRKIHDFGNGGSSPLRPQSGGMGGVRVNGNLSGSWTLSNYTTPSKGNAPGGGGGGYTYITGGGTGRVIIYW